MVALKKTIVIFLKITVILLMLAGCSKDNRLPFTTIGKGNNCDGPKQDKIINSQEEWEEFLMVWPKSEIDRFSEKEIDFSRYQIIAVIDNWRGGGCSINITRVIDYSDKIVVTVRVNAPKGPAPDVLTRPYHIVRIPVSAKSIEFIYIN